MISKNVAQQALDALDWAIAGNKEFGDEPWPEGVAAAEALRSSIAEPEPVVSQQLTAEPLSQPEKQRLWNDACYNNRSSTTDAAMEFGSLVEAAHGWSKPAELSDEEIWKFWWNKPEVPDGEDDSMEAQFVAAVRAIEREIRGTP